MPKENRALADEAVITEGRWSVSRQGMLMKLFALGLAACVLFGLSSEALSETANSSGTLELTGQITEAACEYGPPGAVSFGQQARLIQVTPTVALAVNMATNACRSAEVSFVAFYQKLNTPAYSEEQGVREGVLTISYL